MATLSETLQKEIETSASGTWIGATPYTIVDSSRHIYTVLAIPDHQRIAEAGIVEMARIVDDYIIIDVDISDRPLYERLLEQGIPRENIILSYAGEALPEKDTKG